MRRQIEGLGVGPVRTQVNRGLRHIVTIILLGLGPLAGAAPANVAPAADRLLAADRLPAADALTALMDRLNQFQQLHLRFEQRVTGPGAEPQQGDFYLQRPAQFRLESLDQPLVISDGETIYEYDALLAQLKLQSFDALDASSPAKVLLMSKAELSASFDVTFDAASGTAEHFVLVPTESTSLIAWVRMTFAGGVPSQITLMTQSKMQVSITLSLVSLNDALPASLFEFETPAGIDVIDDR